MGAGSLDCVDETERFLLDSLGRKNIFKKKLTFAVVDEAL